MLQIIHFINLAKERLSCQFAHHSLCNPTRTP